MAVGLSAAKDLLPVKGIRISTAAAGIRYKDREDVVLIELSDESQVAAVFTQNAFRAAPVVLCEQHLSKANPRYLLINSGNANAGTGDLGMQAAVKTCEILAQKTGVSQQSVLPFSTGVIGEILPTQPFESVMPHLVNELDANAWINAAHAIMTTDTVSKGVSKTALLSTGTITITGIAKGSGMICPNMATMLSYVATDAVVSREKLQAMLTDLVDDSFNAITVDGDTSTNDSCVLMATGQSGVSLKTEQDEVLFLSSLCEVMQTLAQAVIRDGEGATKFVTVSVESAENKQEAKRVAYSVAQSPLVKTALFASDANWGRILCAVGYSGVKNLDVNSVSIYLDDVLIVENGARAASYTEAAGSQVMAQEEITIRIVLNRGSVSTNVWTSDLSHDYVSINAEYRS